MSDILKDPNFYKILALLIPGVVILYVRIQFLTGRYVPTTDQLLNYAAVSLVYYGIVFTLVPVVSKFSTINPLTITSAQVILWLAILFVGPVICGILLGIGAQKNWIRLAFRAVHLNLVHPTPTAWDWKFGLRREEWVLVTLKNGTKFAGFVGQNSFMSSDPAERDIFIEKVYDIDDDDQWQARNSSALIVGGEISTVESWPYRDGE